MAENTKYVARVPIVPDDFENKNVHKDHELVMDFNNDDIYLKKGTGYVNITGKIKEDVKEIVDGSAVIHIVTEQTVPPVKERKANHWYWVITKATDASSGGSLPTTSYIYFGVIQAYQHTKNYLLIAQNMVDGPDTVPITILEGYIPCFYVPINYSAAFKNHDTGDNIEFTIEDRIYAMNTLAGTYTAYDVYCLKLFTPGDYKIDLDLAGSDNFIVSFDTNEPGIEGLELPKPLHIHDGYAIERIDDPTWDDPRYLFKGWSTDKIAKVIINPASYIPEDNMTLYAWFEYESDPSLLTYFANFESSTQGGN